MLIARRSSPHADPEENPMELSQETRERIESLVKSSRVFVFMKGSKTFPQCGFSGAVVGALKELDIDFETFDVLKDPEIRQGIKAFSDWPTIPQVYINEEFVGGSDIIREMTTSGELQEMLGIEVEEVEPPTITVTDTAVDAITAASEDEQGIIRIIISSDFRYQMGFADAERGDLVVEANGLTLHLDPGSAKRANGMTIDFETGDNPGIIIQNPNEPKGVQEMSVIELKAAMDGNVELTLFDVRSEEERAIASIEGAILLDQEGAAKLGALPKDAMIVFHCHHGGRSLRAAEHFLKEGYTDVYNLTGGIDAWSQSVDPNVSRY
jgi:monothiol glutaredoxin